MHIGTHKTGTTYLQRWMRSNSQRLASLGLIYPTIGLSGFNAAHSKLSYDVRATRAALETGPRWAELREQLLGCDDDVVISAETFSDKIETASHCHKTVRFFDAIAMQTVFIVLLRDVPAYMNSRYVQDAKNLRTQASFQTYLKAHRDDRAFNYPVMLNPFEAAAPVKVLPYTRQGQVIERRFLESMGRGPRDFDQLTWNSLPHRTQAPAPRRSISRGRLRHGCPRIFPPKSCISSGNALSSWPSGLV